MKDTDNRRRLKVRLAEQGPLTCSTRVLHAGSRITGTQTPIKVQLQHHSNTPTVGNAALIHAHTHINHLLIGALIVLMYLTAVLFLCGWVCGPRKSN